jgi:hypothetical protein
LQFENGGGAHFGRPPNAVLDSKVSASVSASQ